MSWLSVLKVIPWSEVIANGPKVVETARKLWSGDGGAPTSVVTPSANETVPPLVDPQAAWQAVLQRLDSVEQGLSQVSVRQQDSSGLIQALAEQQAQLIEQAERQRRWLRRLLVTQALTLLGLVALGVWVLG